MLLLPEQTIRWMESPNLVTSTWTLQVAVGSPCLRCTPWASLRSTLAACMTAWTLRWLVSPSLPALDLQPPRAALPPNWLPVALTMFLLSKFVMPRPTRWTFSRYRRLYWDCGLDPYFRLQSGRKRLREETRARRYRKVGRPRIWTVRQAASAINSWGIAHGHFIEQAEYRNDESRPKGEWPVIFKALQKKRLEDAAQIATYLVLR